MSSPAITTALGGHGHEANLSLDDASCRAAAIASPAGAIAPMSPEDSTPATMRHVRVMGAPVAVATEADVAATIVAAAEAKRGHWTITANLDHLRRYDKSPAERQLIDEADLVVADGTPLIWASRLAGRPLPERVSGSRMVWSICDIASARGQSIFLLGGDPGVAERAASAFKARCPDLRIAGIACPPLGFEHDELELDRLQRQLVEAAPEVVFLALGFPKQDLLIRVLRKAMPHASFIGVGISLSYAAGDLLPPPEWICRLGFEWAYRLAQEPTRKLVRRYLIDGLPFAIRLLASAVRCRLGGNSPRWRD